MAEEKPLIERKPGTAKDSEIFDVGRAFESGEVAGTIVSDKKRKGVFGQLKDAATEIAGSATKAVQEVKVFEEPEEPKVTPGTERKDIIERAVQDAEQAPQDDHDVVIERIRTFQKDAERVSGKPYLIKKNKEQTKSSWSHVIGDKPAEQKKETETKPAPQVTETIRRAPKPQMPQQMERAVIPTRKVPTTESVVEQTPPPQPEPQVEETPKPTPPVPPRPQSAPQESTRTRSLVTIGVGVLAAIIVLGGGVYLYTLLTNPTSTTVTQEPIELDLNEYLPLEQLATLPVRLENQEATISQVVIVTRQGETTPLTTTQFLTAVAENVPSTLVRSLNGSMVAGGIRTGGGTYPYLLFRTINFDNAFAGMLAWERSMGTDLNELFTRAQGDIFVDRVLENQHVRVLYDVNGIERLVYGFVSGRMLIITNTSASFKAIVSEL
ncbi:hypothetical protein KTR10_00800 [Candidatus Kaiserbacteria bacterium]|nr:hypothetical protein [Candidatus Kaiserbacteria bacterium]